MHFEKAFSYKFRPGKRMVAVVDKKLSLHLVSNVSFLAAFIARTTRARADDITTEYNSIGCRIHQQVDNAKLCAEKCKAQS